MTNNSFGRALSVPALPHVLSEQPTGSGTAASVRRHTLNTLNVVRRFTLVEPQWTPMPSQASKGHGPWSARTRFTGIDPDDPPQLRRYKRTALWVNVLCLAMSAVQLAFVLMTTSRVASQGLFYYRVVSAALCIAMDVFSIGWYFAFKSHSFMKYTGTVLGFLVIVEKCLTTGCNIIAVGADLFLPSIIVVPTFFCMGASRREGLIYVALSSLLAAALYAAQFATTGLQGPPAWCPFAPLPEDLMTVAIEPLCYIVSTHVVVLLGISVLLGQTLQYEKTLEADAALAREMLHAVAHLDLKAMDDLALASEWKAEVSATQSAMVELLQTMRRLRPYVPDTLFRTHGTSPLSEAGDVSDADTEILDGPDGAGGPGDEYPPGGPPGVDVSASSSSLEHATYPISLSTNSMAPLQQSANWALKVETTESPRTSFTGRPLDPGLGPHPQARASLERPAKSPDLLRPDTPVRAERDLVLQTGLQQKPITILVANVGRVHATAAELGPGIEGPLNECIAAMVGVIKRHRGTVVSFAGGILIAAFNAVSRNSAHALYACQSALEIRGSVQKLRMPMPVRVGLHTCGALVGNVGTSYIATFHILTRGLAVSYLLSRLNRQLGTHVLVSHDCMKAVKDHFDFRGVDWLRFVDGPEPGEEDRLEVHELLREADSSDEWMYSLQWRESRVRDFDIGWDHMKQGDYGTAAKAFQRHLREYEDDECAQRLMHLAEVWSHQSDPLPYERRVGVPWECLEQEAPLHRSQSLRGQGSPVGARERPVQSPTWRGPEGRGRGQVRGDNTL